MRVVTRSHLEAFKQTHPDAGSSLDSWYNIITRNDFSDFIALKAVFGSKVDVVAKGFVFDISGNKYRLAASIHFNTQMVYVREIMTHADYSKETWKTRHKDFH